MTWDEQTKSCFYCTGTGTSKTIQTNNLIFVAFGNIVRPFNVSLSYKVQTSMYIRNLIIACDSAEI